MSDMRGADIEIVERRKRPAQDSVGTSIVVPTEVRINGMKVAMPRDMPITVHEMSSQDVAMVTLTVFARRIFVGHEDIDPEVVDGVAAAQQALMDAQRDALDASVRAKAAIEDAQRRLAVAHQNLQVAQVGEEVSE